MFLSSRKCKTIHKTCRMVRKFQLRWEENSKFKKKTEGTTDQQLSSLYSESCSENTYAEGKMEQAKGQILKWQIPKFQLKIHKPSTKPQTRTHGQPQVQRKEIPLGCMELLICRYSLILTSCANLEGSATKDNKSQLSNSKLSERLRSLLRCGHLAAGRQWILAVKRRHTLNERDDELPTFTYFLVDFSNP